MKWPWKHRRQDEGSRWSVRLSDRHQWVIAGAGSGLILGGGVAYRGVITDGWYEAVGLIITGSAIIAGTGVAAWKVARQKDK